MITQEELDNTIRELVTDGGEPQHVRGAQITRNELVMNGGDFVRWEVEMEGQVRPAESPLQCAVPCPTTTPATSPATSPSAET